MNTHRRKRTDDVGEGRLAENRHIHMGTLAEEFDHFLLRRVHRVEALLRVRRVMNNNDDETAIEGQQLGQCKSRQFSDKSVQINLRCHDRHEIERDLGLLLQFLEHLVLTPNQVSPTCANGYRGGTRDGNVVGVNRAKCSSKNSVVAISGSFVY